MTKAQQARLASKIRKAAENQGIKQIDIARACGTSSGNFSYAMACKSPMSEEKWRLACEHVGVDYDAILAEGVRLDAQDAAPEEVRELPAEAVQMPITPPREIGACGFPGSSDWGAFRPGGVPDHGGPDRGALGGGHPFKGRRLRLDEEGAGDP